MSEKQKVIQCSLRGVEVDTFDSAFGKSGMRNEAEFLRYLIKQYDLKTIYVEPR